MLWGFIRRYAPGVSPETHPRLDRLVGHAVRYFPRLRAAGEASTGCRPRPSARRSPELAEALGAHEGSTDAEALQAVVYEVGRRHFPDTSGKSKSPDGRPGVSQTWFATIYQILLGKSAARASAPSSRSTASPRPARLIARALAGELLREHEAFLASRRRPAAE